MFDVCRKRNLVRKIHVKSCHKQLRKLQQRNVFEKISLFEFSRIFKKIRSSRIFTIRTVTNILILSLSFSIVSLDDETRMNNTIWHLKFLSFKKLRLCGNLCFHILKNVAQFTDRLMVEIQIQIPLKSANNFCEKHLQVKT